MWPSVLDHFPIGAFLVDSKHIVRNWNRVIEEWTRVSRTQIDGRPLGEFFPQFQTLRYQKTLQGIFNPGAVPVVLSPALHRGLLPAFKPDGTQRVLIITLAPVYDEKVSEHCLVTVQDITDLTRRNIELQENRKLLQTVIDSIPHSIFVKDQEERFLLVNKANELIWDKSNREIIGKNLMDLKPEFPDEIEYTRRTDQQVLSSGDQINDHILRSYGNENIRNFHITKSPLKNGKGKIIGIVGVAVDETERIQAEEKIKALERMEAIGQLIGGVCHNINNINQIISGNLSMIESELSSGHNKFIKNIENAIKRATKFTDQLLKYTRQRLRFISNKFDLNELMEELIDSQRKRMPPTIEIKEKKMNGLWPVKADIQGFRDAIGHLFLNAEEAMPEGGVLLIETSNLEIKEGDEKPDPEMKTGNYVNLTISDTGIGMTPNVVRKVFEPFFTTKNMATHSGFGLSTVYWFVKQSEGFVNIHSKVGRGTSVHIYLRGMNA